MEENHSYSSVIGNSSMPYFNGLAQQYGLATQYYANTHPSIGNYFMLTTGQIITNDDSYSGTVSADNLVRKLIAAGKTWKSYAESLPSVGYLGSSSPYAKRHNPFAYFTDVVNSSTEKLNLVPFTQLKTDLANGNLPDLAYIVPNMNNDAHNGTLGTADAWLKNNLASVLSSSTFQQDGLLIILFDESVDSDTSHGGGHIAMLMIGPQVKRGYKSTITYQHQSTLRLIEQALGMSSFPGAAASAPSMGEFFSATTAPPPPPPPPPGIVVGAPDFAVSATPGAVSVPRGGSAAITVNLSPSNNFSGMIALSCANLPAHASCAWSKGNVNGSAASSSQLTINTSDATVAQSQTPSSSGWLEAMSLAPGAFGIFGAVLMGDHKSRRRYWTTAVLVLLLALTLALIGCSGTKIASPAGTQSSQTSAGLYSITITAASGSVQHNIPVVLTVQ
jgi:phosphatidylinositol-3-phosphatase